MGLKAGPTSEVIGVSTGRRSEAGEGLSPSELANIGENARGELSGLPAAETDNWKAQFQKKMERLAGKDQNAAVRPQIHALLQSLDMPGLKGMPAATPASPGWQANGQQVRGAAAVAAVGAVKGPEELPPRPLSLTGNLVMLKGQQGEADRWFMASEKSPLSKEDLAAIQADGKQNGIKSAVAMLEEKTGGKMLELQGSTTRKTGPNGSEMSWMQGLAGSGPMTVRGSLQPSKHENEPPKFVVEDYAPGTSNQYVHGRISEAALKLDDKNLPDDQRKVIVDTARGPVEITGENLRKQLIHAPRQLVTLPGDPVKKDGKLVYEGDPVDFVSLGRANANGDGTTGAKRDEVIDAMALKLNEQKTALKKTPQPDADRLASLDRQLANLEDLRGRLKADPNLSIIPSTEFAWSRFSQKPTLLVTPGDTNQINDNQRKYFRGHFELSPDGKELLNFRAVWAGGPTEGSYLAPAQPDEKGPKPVDDVAIDYSKQDDDGRKEAGYKAKHLSALGTRYGFQQGVRSGFDGFMLHNPGAQRLAPAPPPPPPPLPVDNGQ